ncbi:MAG: protein disulfide oxidoreductase [Gammaproteobacteria bacterium]|nr:protein disulfide oxidoreductase [Gammaproteobacteria bacterium]
MKLNKKILRWVFELTLILVVLVAVRLWLQRDVVSGTAPDFSAYTLNNKSFELYQNTRRPILVHFWATWCPVCKLEQSNIDNIAKDYSVITVAMQSGSNQEVQQFMSEQQLSFNVINDESGLLSKKYNIKGVPVSFVINDKNKIEFVEVGYTTEMGLRLRMWWAGL